MKLRSKMIANIAAFATVFAVATMQNTQAHAGFFGFWWPSITNTDLGSGR